MRDTYIGRASRQLRLQPSAWRNPYKISQYGRDLAISMFRQALQARAGLSRRRGHLPVFSIFSSGVLCGAVIGAAFRGGGKGGGGGTRDEGRRRRQRRLGLLQLALQGLAGH